MSRRDIAEQRTSTLQQILYLSIEAAQHNLDFVTSHLDPLAPRLKALENAANQLVQAIDEHARLMQTFKELEKSSNGNHDKEATQQQLKENQKQIQECEQRFQEAERAVKTDITEVESAIEAATASIARIRPAFESSAAAIKATTHIARQEVVK